MANRTNHPPTRLRDKGDSCTSGIRGVSFVLREYSPNSWIAYVSVCWYDSEGYQRNSQISVKKNGARKALQHALKLRRDMGVPRSKLPTLAQAIEIYEDWFHGVKVPKSRFV